MKQTRAMGWGGLTAALGLSLALLLPNVSLADRTVYAGEILIISDEIFGNSIEVTRPGGGGGGGGGDTGGCASGGDSSGTDSSNTSSNSSGGTGGNNTSNNCSNNSSTDT